jgi:hypothetical protein
MVELKVLRETADLTALIVLSLKDEYKNLNLDDLKHDYNLIIRVAQLITDKMKDKKVVSRSTSRRIDKNELLMNVFTTLFKDLSEDDITHINQGLTFCIDNKIIGKESFFAKILRLCLKFL